MPSICAVIPARYASTRFPGKMLAPLLGKPLLQHVWDNLRTARSISRILIATDDERIRAAATAFGAEVVMTDPSLPSGTDRIATATRDIEADWFLNVQGDEPLVTGAVLDAFIASLDGASPMATLARRITDPAALTNPDVVKVVTDLQGRALYFSRAPIPHVRDAADQAEHWQHLGIYIYRPSTLRQLVSLPPSPLEQAEKLEQLRALQNGIAIQVVPTTVETIGVDRPEDLQRVAARLRS
jgi:3-deoxy-manno-octulosonate cytidylyltransferase (CMP-KDO synthetase)